MIIDDHGTSNTSIQSNEIIRKADIIDRTGTLLATSITTGSCYADPSVIINICDAAKKLSNIPELPTFEVIKQKLRDKNKHFVWIIRHVPPQIQEKIMDLGIPGIALQKDYKRIYVHGNLFSHVIGCSDIDGNGVSGLEKKFNKELNNQANVQKKLAISLDIRLQSIIHEELQGCIQEFGAIGGNAILMRTDGEILALVSLPDFDPNDLAKTMTINMFNRNTLGVFEPGSTFKILNVAIALDSGAARVDSTFDATTPIRLGRHSIKDFRGKNRKLSLVEAFVYSSNIAAVKIAQSFGVRTQVSYMKRMGIFDKTEVELPEVGTPIIPKRWSEATSMTVAYGYGVSVSPLQLLTVISSIVNDGRRISPTVLLGNGHVADQRVVSSRTSEIVRDLMRAVICHGTGKKAGVEGVDIIGKTGTSYKISGRGYGTDANRARITTFVGGFPKDKPKYMLLLMLDNPRPREGTYGFATAGWNVAPLASKIFKRIIPLLNDGLKPPPNQNLQVTKFLKLN
jgi:cell division protein FtsI (penicillin-binding protein 3)